MQTAMIVMGLVFGVMIFLFYIARIKMKNTPMVADNDKILTLTEANFKQHANGRVMLVDFWASWCAPCRMMAPILNDVAGELKGNSKIGKVDIEKFQSLASKHKVRSIPTLILFKNGIEVNRFVGVKQRDFLLKEINKIK